MSMGSGMVLLPVSMAWWLSGACDMRCSIYVIDVDWISGRWIYFDGSVRASLELRRPSPLISTSAPSLHGDGGSRRRWPSGTIMALVLSKTRSLGETLDPRIS